LFDILLLHVRRIRKLGNLSCQNEVKKLLAPPSSGNKKVFCVIYVFPTVFYKRRFTLCYNKYVKRTKQTLLFIQLTSIIASNLLAPIYAVYVKGIGGDLMTAGTAIAMNYAVIGALVIASGRFANKHHTEKIQLIIGYFLSAFAAYCYVITKNPTQLFFTQIVSGISIAIISPAFSGLFSKNIEEGKHTASWGDYWGLTYWGAAVTAITAGFVSQNYGFNAVFFFMMGLNGMSALGALYLYFLPSKKK
jgi:MFS family permease